MAEPPVDAPEAGDADQVHADQNGADQVDAEPLVDAEPPVRVAVLTSTDDARLRHLLADDPNRGDRYEVVAGVVDLADEGGTALLEDYGVPATVRDIHAFYDERDAPLEELAVREAFDAGTADRLAEHDPDLVVLAGYLHVLTAPMLDRYPIVSAHHGDLTVRDGAGRPVYTGLDAVEDAVRAGETATRETTHVVTEAVDAGPVVARSRPYEVHRELVEDALEGDAADVLDAYVFAHRQWMVRAGGGPTLAKTLELIADGRVALAGDGVAVDGRRGYYQLGEGVVETTPRAGGDDVV